MGDDNASDNDSLSFATICGVTPDDNPLDEIASDLPEKLPVNRPIRPLVNLQDEVVGQIAYCIASGRPIVPRELAEQVGTTPATWRQSVKNIKVQNAVKDLLAGQIRNVAKTIEDLDRALVASVSKIRESVETGKGPNGKALSHNDLVQTFKILAAMQPQGTFAPTNKTKQTIQTESTSVSNVHEVRALLLADGSRSVTLPGAPHAATPSQSAIPSAPSCSLTHEETPHESG